jgi:hypothetical protein
VCVCVLEREREREREWFDSVVVCLPATYLRACVSKTKGEGGVVCWCCCCTTQVASS